MKRFTGLITLILIAFIKPAPAQQIKYINATLFDDAIRDVYISGNRAYGITRHSFQVFSISGDDSPQIIAGIPLPGDLKKMAVSGRYAYIANYDLGLHIINISYPANPTQINLFETDNPTAVAIQGNYAYLTSHYWNSLEIIDVSDPYNPNIIREYYLPYGSSRSEDIDVQDGHAFIADSINGLYIVNVDNPSSPYLESIIGIEYVPNAVYVGGDFAYVVSSSGYSISAFEIFNVADPSNPFLAGNYLDIVSNFKDISVLNNYAYITNSWEMYAMIIFDVSDPSNPTYVNTFANYDCVAFSLSIDDTLVCLGSCKPFTLTTANLSNPQNPIAIGYYSATGNIRDIFVVADYGYVATDEPSIISMNLSDPYFPEILDSQDRIGIPYKIFVVDSLLYLANSWRGMEIFNISDPEDIQFISPYYTYTTISLHVSGDYAYLANYTYGIEIVDVSNPSAPIQAGIYDEYTGRFYDVMVMGDYAYVACGPYMGFQILDVSNPGDPVMIGGHVVYADARAVDVSGDYAFVVAGPTGLLIFNISDPTNPVQVSQFDAPGYAIDVVADNNYAYIADTTCGLFIINVQDPTSPLLVDTYDTPGAMLNIHLEGDYIYVADKYSLLILHFDRETGIIEHITEYPEILYLLKNYPNPFNASTIIEYSLIKDSDVVIDIYDILGRKVETLVAGKQTAGTHSLVWDPGNLTSGVYFFQITADNYTEAARCILLK
ncbi:MAG: T9SS type A sorting domain-containing protein [Candidatus Zixiibacteriota bacterium]|nr:MAG: T9SS type A sorting domain-containing protein [candidate division Zixibacteria bacterium]